MSVYLDVVDSVDTPTTSVWAVRSVGISRHIGSLAFQRPGGCRSSRRRSGACPAGTQCRVDSVSDRCAAGRTRVGAWARRCLVAVASHTSAHLQGLVSHAHIDVGWFDVEVDDEPSALGIPAAPSLSRETGKRVPVDG